MKKLMIWTLFVILLISFSFVAVHAQQTSLAPVATFNQNSPTHGSATQEASNPKHEDLTRREVSLTSSIGVKNNDPNTITVDAFSVTPSLGLSKTDLAISINGAAEGSLTQAVAIAGNSTATFSVKARISEKVDAIDANGDEVAFLVATVDLLQSGSKRGQIDIWMQRENSLTISDLNAVINDKGSQSIDEGDNLENLKPGDRIDLEIEAENEFDDETNLDIDDAKVRIKCANEDNLDFDDKTGDFGDINTESQETESLTFSANDDAADETTSCSLTIDGKDKNGAKHGSIITFDIEIVRKSHDITIKTVSANPTSLSCSDNTINLRVDYINLGRSNEDRVAIEVTSRILNYQERVAGLELDEDDREETAFIVPANPRIISQGPFVFQVQTFYDNTKLSDTETLTMDNLCSEAQPINTGEGSGSGGVLPRPVANSLVVGAEKTTLNIGSLASIPVKVINKESQSVEYTLTLANTEDFAEPSSAKTIFLTPGQESTVFMNLRAKSNAVPGTYSSSVILQDEDGRTLETKTFTIEVAGSAESESGITEGLGSLFGGETNSRIFWIIGDIILIIIAIFFIKLIFTGGRKRARDKRMADYEAEMVKKRKR